jgi:hypothetical protein
VDIVHPDGLVTRNIHANASGWGCGQQQKILGQEGEAQGGAEACKQQESRSENSTEEAERKEKIKKACEGRSTAHPVASYLQ